MSFWEFMLVVTTGLFGFYLVGYLVGLGAWHGYGHRAAVKRDVDAAMRDLQDRIHR